MYINYTRTRFYVTLHGRKVPVEEQKQLETTRVTVIKLPMFSGDTKYVSGPKVMVVSKVI